MTLMNIYIFLDLQRPVAFQRQNDLQRPLFGFGRLFENSELLESGLEFSFCQ